MTEADCYSFAYRGYMIKSTFSGYFIVEKDNTIIFRPNTIEEAKKKLTNW